MLKSVPWFAMYFFLMYFRVDVSLMYLALLDARECILVCDVFSLDCLSRAGEEVFGGVQVERLDNEPLLTAFHVEHGFNMQCPPHRFSLFTTYGSAIAFNETFTLSSRLRVTLHTQYLEPCSCLCTPLQQWGNCIYAPLIAV